MSLRKFLPLLLLILTAITACNSAPADLTTAEEADVYATVIRQIYTVDDTFGGTLQPPTLYVIGHTDDSAANPGNSDGDAAPIPDAVRQAVTGALADLPTDVIWVESRDEVSLDPDSGAVANGGAMITLGNIQPQDDGVLHVPASIYVGFLAAGGQTYVLEQVDGAWAITGTTGPVWIS